MTCSVGRLRTDAVYIFIINIFMSHLPNETGPSFVTFPQLDAYLALEIGHVLSYPLD